MTTKKHLAMLALCLGLAFATSGCNRDNAASDDDSAESEKASKKTSSKAKSKKKAEPPPEPENGLPRMAELKKRAYELGWRLNDETVDVVTEGRNPYHQHSVTLARKDKLVLLQVQKFETSTVAKMTDTSKGPLAMKVEGSTVLKVGIIPKDEGEAFLAELLE